MHRRTVEGQRMMPKCFRRARTDARVTLFIQISSLRTTLMVLSNSDNTGGVLAPQSRVRKFWPPFVRLQWDPGLLRFPQGEVDTFGPCCKSWISFSQKNDQSNSREKNSFYWVKSKSVPNVCLLYLEGPWNKKLDRNSASKSTNQLSCHVCLFFLYLKMISGHQ